ncbi:MAG: restriction endonuclease [Firmicutes bacterium]|nr:restriction endonuclease [Bacillota bacterium]
MDREGRNGEGASGGGAIRLRMSEWQTAAPDPRDPLGSRLVGLNLSAHPGARRLAEELSREGILEVLELVDGLHIRTSSYVGVLRLGPLHISIEPKIPGPALLSLLRYAYGLRQLRLVGEVDITAGQLSFPDLLLHQLAAEAGELVARGLHRRYIRQHEVLPAPRGRIDFATLARRHPAEAALPCWHHPRLADCLPNQVLLAGLQFGTTITEDVALRGNLRRVAALLADDVTPARLDRPTFRRLHLQMDRLTRSYRPALTLIEMLVEGQGLSADGEAHPLQLPGFLFDMNRFFQGLLTRFLTENLEGYTVRPEYRLTGMLGYHPDYNPRGRASPTPRPDMLVVPATGAAGPSGSGAAATPVVLDAKYRDLWENPPPRDMLYQLAMYALSMPGRSAAILYPTTCPAASEQRVEVRDPASGTRHALVDLRPVHIDYLASLIDGSATPSAVLLRRRRQYAHYLAFSRSPRHESSGIHPPQGCCAR